MHVLIYIIYFEQKLPKTKCYNVVCMHHIHLSTNEYVIRYKQCKLFIIHSSYQRTVLLAKRKKHLHSQLDFNDRYYYTGNKVKSNRGREEN